MEGGLETDVVVAGAGAAGFSAALRAAQLGAHVVLAEARETYLETSNTAMSTSMIPAAGSRWQRAAGIDDSPDRFRADIDAKTRDTADPVVSTALTEVAPELVEWLADEVRVPLELVTDFNYPGHSRHRCHTVPDRAGRTLQQHMLARLRSSEDRITLVTPLRLCGVERSGDPVRAALVAAPGGAVERVSSRAVVMATGGFGADADRVRREIPEIAQATYFGGDGCLGDALRIGEGLQADTAYLDSYQGHGSLAVPHGVLLTWASVMHGAVLVNDRGERFGDETTGYSEFGATVVAQPGGEAWVVLDRRIDELCASFADHRRLRAAGALRWADDVDGLATIVGCPSAALSATLTSVRDAFAGTAPDPFGRRTWETPPRPPFAAVRVTGALFHTQGGLRVGPEGQVLADGAPIRGLFAAGGAAAGMSGHGASGYLAGNGLLSALGLGYLAGAAAAREAAAAS